MGDAPDTNKEEKNYDEEIGIKGMDQIGISAESGLYHKALALGEEDPSSWD